MAAVEPLPVIYSHKRLQSDIELVKLSVVTRPESERAKVPGDSYGPVEGVRGRKKWIRDRYSD